MGMKSFIKAQIRRFPIIWDSYWRVKQELLRLWMLRYFFYDIRNTYRAMFWVPNTLEPRTLAASLIFQYHKIEKGMSMPGPRRLFGLDPATEVMKILGRWSAAGCTVTDPIYLGALETLHGYVAHIQRYDLDPKGKIVPIVQEFLGEFPHRALQLTTPIALPVVAENVNSPHTHLAQIAIARRSVRDFSPQPVPESLLVEAIRIAQLAPSACNRQPCRVYALHDPALQVKVLSYQNGNRGFGHSAPLILVITADESCYFDASERHQPYIDGGLFSMSLCYALTSMGLASCCLNWCVPVANDVAVHKLLDISASERIMMMMAVGIANDDCKVPRSPRRQEASVLVNINTPTPAN